EHGHEGFQAGTETADLAGVDADGAGEFFFGQPARVAVEEQVLERGRNHVGGRNVRPGQVDGVVLLVRVNDPAQGIAAAHRGFLLSQTIRLGPGLLVPKLCLGTSGPEALLRRNDKRTELDASLQGPVPKQSFEAVRSQAELGNESLLPSLLRGGVALRSLDQMGAGLERRRVSWWVPSRRCFPACRQLIGEPQPTTNCLVFSVLSGLWMAIVDP